MAWVHAVLAVGCLACGLLHLARLVLMRGDRLGEASHAAMGVGMAAMFSPLGDPMPAWVWIAVFAGTGVWFAGLALRSGPGTRDAAYHVVGAGAMLFMLLAGTRDATGGHSHSSAGLGVASVAVLLLAGFFAWHGLRCGDRLIATSHGAAPVDAGCDCPSGTTADIAVAAPPATGLRSVRTATAAHIGMAGAMTVMFLQML